MPTQDSGPSQRSTIIGENVVINHYPPVTINPCDDPERFCPICNGFDGECFHLPGITRG